MNPGRRELARRLAALGREVTPENLAATRELYTPLHPVAPFEGITIRRDIRYGDDQRHRLDLFTPAAADAPLPVLIFIHGGGFVRGDKYTPGTPFYDNVAVWAVRNGLIGINMTHRLAPEHPWPAGIEDIAQVIEWTRGAGVEHGIDTQRVYLMGQSAGAAHIGGYLSHPEIYAHRPAGLAGAILLSGIYRLEYQESNERELAYYGSDPDRYPERSSLAGLRETGTPMLVACAEHDPDNFQRQTLELLRARLDAQGSMPRFVHMLGQNHLSGILHLGLDGDRLGSALLDLVADSGT